MRIVRLSSKEDVGRQAAEIGAEAIAAAIATDGEATIILASGASQFEMLAHLVEAEIDWAKVTAFHLDEYVGIAADHPADQGFGVIGHRKTVEQTADASLTIR